MPEQTPIETWLLRVSGPASVSEAQLANELKVLLHPVESVQVDRLLFKDGPLVRVILKVEAKPAVVKAIRACSERFSGLRIEIETRHWNTVLSNADRSDEIRKLWRDIAALREQEEELLASVPPRKGEQAESSLRYLYSSELLPSNCLVRVFYATDRRRSDLTYGKERGPDGKVEVGECEISIPRDHRMGRLERPSILKLEFSENAEKHIVLQKTVPLENLQFWQTVSSTTQGSAANEAFVFVHGYCTSFEDAVLRTAQMAYDLGFDGAPISYSWPSQGELTDYPKDETNAQWSIPHLKNFLKDLSQYSGAKTVHIIAHSMGNRIVSHALQLLYAESRTETCHMQHIVLTAPDIDADTFKEMAVAIKSLADRVTLYCSSRDKALGLSKQFHGYQRLGETPPLVIQGIDTIDASEVDTSLIGHSYFGENRSVLSDIFWLLKSNKSPTDRFGIKVVMQGASSYYAFRP